MTDSVIRQLATLLSQQLQSVGADSYHLHYTGSGDSTDGCTITTSPAGKEEIFDALQVSYTSFQNRWDQASNSWKGENTPRTASYEDAAYELANLLWNYAGEGGWYNNAGGYGDVTIFPGGFIEFRHVNYDRESYDDEEDGIEDEDRATTQTCHWRFNVLVGPIKSDYEEVLVDVIEGESIS